MSEVWSSSLGRMVGPRHHYLRLSRHAAGLAGRRGGLRSRSRKAFDRQGFARCVGPAPRRGSAKALSYGGRPPAASARRDVESRSAPSKPVATFEPDVEPNADRSDDAEDDEISPLRLQFGHILEIHAVDSGNRGRHREDRGPGGKLTRDRTLALLFEQEIGRAHV